MKKIAQRTLPDGYQLINEINLQKNGKMLLILNLAAFALLIPMVAFLIWYGNLLHPGGISSFSYPIPGRNLLYDILAVLGTLVITILLHEGIHGFFFWQATGTRPTFAIRWSYAYAAAPGWYIHASAYRWIGISPLVLLDLLLLILIWCTPAGWLFLLGVAFVINSCGAVGDIYIVSKLMFMQKELLVEDRGDIVRIFQRVP